VSSKRAAQIVNIRDAKQRARRSLPRVLYDYIEGGADDELTVTENEHAFRTLKLRPRMGIDVGEPHLSTTVVGSHLALPVLLAPCGFVQTVHPDGAVGVARAASAAGTIAILSRLALCTPQEVARRSGGIRWFQVNSTGGRDEVKRLLDMAAAADFTGLVITLDAQPPGNHERDVRHGVSSPIRVTPRLVGRLGSQILARPRWTLNMLPAGVRALHGRRSMISFKALTTTDPPKWPRFTWSDIEWLREQWSGYVIVKGLLTAADAIAARDAGADAIIVSNHGGRQLDGVPATISVLPEIVAATGDSTEIMIDGGIRRGTDVIKALSLGARAVLIGRPFVYGLAAAGQPGVERILDIFKVEIVRTLKLIGCPGLTELDATWLQPYPSASGVGSDSAHG
jgi:L-lactate dehydrogenase (cytochrome)